MQSQAAPFHPAPLKPQPEDAGEAGQDAHSYHGVTGFHAAGPADVAQGSLAAAGGNTSNANIHVNGWAKCRAFLGDVMLAVIA